MMKYLFILFLVFKLTTFFSQGGSIVMGTGQIVNSNLTTIYALGDVKQYNDALIANYGDIYITKNWENNSVTSGLDTLTSNGEVILDGEYQVINGSSPTYFYDLVFSNSEIKSAESNFYVTNDLNLNNAVLELNNNQVHLTNPNVNSLIWLNGYISSNNLEGYFLRSTNTTSNYSFPLGSTDLDNNYRAIELTPTTNDLSVFGAKLSAMNAGLETGVSAAGSQAPFDLNSKEATLSELNPDYYWAVNRFAGDSDANVSFYTFKSDAENVFTSLAKWSSINEIWEDANHTILPPASAKPQYNSPDLLVRSNEPLTYEDDIYVLSDINLVFPQAFTPNGDGLNDALVIENIDLYPENSIEIFNRWGEKVFASKPYKNDWSGENKSSTLKFQGETLDEDTYFYILKLEEGTTPIKRYIELIRN